MKNEFKNNLIFSAAAVIITVIVAIVVSIFKLSKIFVSEVE